MLKPVDYDRQQHQTYAKGRALSPQTLGRWMEAFAAHLPARRPLSLIDLGSGTGRFTPSLAETFGGPVAGVEPAARMREVAEAEAAHPAVRYLAGEAGAIPMPDASADGVLMFLSFHHVRDRAAAAAENARVLRPDGRVLMRSTFSDRVPEPWWQRFFPRTPEIERSVFPSVAETRAAFAGAGLGWAELAEVELPGEADMAAAAGRLKLKAVSIFEHLTDAEWDEGVAGLDAALAAGTLEPEGPRRVDLLVLGRG